MPTASSTLIGTAPPDFTLLDTLSQNTLQLQDCVNKQGLLVMFLCNHCPYVRHLETALTSFCQNLQQQHVGVVAISANDPENYPADAPEKMAERAQELNWSFPYLFDSSQDVARNWGAVCTPEFFLYNSDLNCVYHGRFDNSLPNNGEAVTGADLQAAVDAMLSGAPPLTDQKPSMGCSIKWR
ncbi:MAG: thioredoxin family protein [Gammaproteobacteria bacterium]